MKTRHFFALVLIFIAVVVVAESSEPLVAISGYDTVAYFTLEHATRGEDDIYADYAGFRWLFANEEHRELFLAEPERYVPYFGEYCANGLAQGEIIDANPKHWLVDDDRLFLFYSARGRRTWLRGDLESEFAKAVSNYPVLTGEELEKP